MQISSRAKIAILFVAAAYVGCSSNKPAESPQGGQGGFASAPTTGGFANAPPTATTTAPPPATTTTTAPPPATTTAPPFDPSALGVMLAPLLTPLAQKSAAGMQPEGQPIAGIAQQGVPLERTVTLQPGKCYTGIAVGTPPITDLSIELVLNMPPAPPQVLSQSSGGGSQPVMAGSPNCFKNPTPFPGQAIFRVTSKAGNGGVLAQLYVK